MALTFIDFFAGIGGFREGMVRAGHKPIGWCEKDKFAQKAYRIIHKPEGEWFVDDITTVRPEELPEADLYCGGFPCQSFSTAGKRGGFDDIRGTLFFEVMRLAKARQPKYLFLENVKGLLSHNGGRTFATILGVLWECGYNAKWQTLNSKDFGVPQNRERVFIVGNLRGTPRPKIFPIRRKNKGNSIQISGGEGISYCLDANYYRGTSPGNIEKCRRTHIWVSLTEKRSEEAKKIRQEYQQKYGKDFTPWRSKVIATRQDNIANTLTATQSIEQLLMKKQNYLKIKEPNRKGYTIAKPGDSINYKFPDSKTRRGRVNKTKANTLETINKQGVITEELKIRRLTPLECFRLQGFPDEWYFKLRGHISDTQLYRLAGNAVTVPVIEEIARRLV